MNKLFSLILILIISNNISFAQYNYGARLTAMGNNGAAVKDIWSINPNPSGITNLVTPTLALNYGKYLFDSELSEQSLAFVLPIKNNFIGISLQRYGITEFNEIKAGFALAKNFGDKLFIGIKANYHQLKIINYGATNGISVDVGAIYNLNEFLTFGASVSNPSLQKYNNKSVDNNIPTLINIGATYKPSNKLMVATTISKDIKEAIDFGLGIEYAILDLLSLRGGLTAKPFKHYAGFGLNYKKIMVDFAIQSDPNLGYSPQIGLAYAF